MKQFHPLTVSGKRNETRDSVRISLDVPDALQDEYQFLAGQHLPVQIERDGKKLRRTYSICSRPGEFPLEIGVRVQPGGQFSAFADNELQVGQSLAVLPPNGRFHVQPDAVNANRYLGFAAGSGITPILSIVAALLHGEPRSRFTLFYGNRKQSTTMFIDDLFALKNLYPERLQLHFIFSQEEQEFPIAAGRLDRSKVHELYRQFVAADGIAASFVCGPESMIDTVTEALISLGVDAEHIFAERFGAPRQRSAPLADQTVSADQASITVLMDGHRKTFSMPRSGINIVDAAAEEGIELPYSCKGGVCATCRTFVASGEVHMQTNYGLEPWEVEKGFVLACQCQPQSDEVLLDYDRT